MSEVDDYLDRMETQRTAAGFKPKKVSEVDALMADAPAQKRSWGQAAGDTGIGLAQGAAGLVKTAGEVGGLIAGDMDNAVTHWGAETQQSLESHKSEPLREKIEQRSRHIDAQDSTAGKAWTAIKDTVTDPALAVDTVAQNAASVVPGAGAGRLVAGAKAAGALAAAERAAISKLPGTLTAAERAASGFVPMAEREAIARTAAKAGTAAAVGTGAVQQGADVAQQAYDDAMAKPDKVWDANADFQAALAANGGDRGAATRSPSNPRALHSALRQRSPWLRTPFLARRIWSAP